MSGGLSRSRLVKAAFVVVAVVAGKELVSHLPDSDASFRPFEVAGEFDDEVTLRTGTVQLEQVQLSTTVLTPTEGYRTPGLWVVASVTLEPAQAKASFGYAAVRSADEQRTWSNHSRSWNSCASTPPGMPITCDLIFEVPPESLVGADLLLATGTDHRHDTLAVIDLALTAEQVAAAADAEPVTVREARRGGNRD